MNQWQAATRSAASPINRHSGSEAIGFSTTSTLRLAGRGVDDVVDVERLSINGTTLKAKQIKVLASGYTWGQADHQYSPPMGGTSVSRRRTV